MNEGQGPGHWHITATSQSNYLPHPGVLFFETGNMVILLRDAPNLGAMTEGRSRCRAVGHPGDRTWASGGCSSTGPSVLCQCRGWSSRFLSSVKLQGLARYHWGSSQRLQAVAEQSRLGCLAPHRDRGSAMEVTNGPLTSGSLKTAKVELVGQTAWSRTA